MATKKTTKKEEEKKKKKKTRSEEDKRNQKIADRRAEDRKMADEEANKFYAPGSLGRMDAATPIGQIAAAPRVAQVSTTMQGGAQSIAQAEDSYVKAQQRDAMVNDALMRMQSGLGGFSSPELQAQREQMSRDVLGQEATAARQLKVQAAEAGVSGATALSAANKLKRQSMQTRAMQDSDLLAKNAAEQRARLNDYGAAASDAWKTQASIQDQALSRLLGARKDVADYQQRGEQTNTANQLTQSQLDLDTGRANTDIAFKNQQVDRDTKMYNQGQEEKEKAGRLGIYYGEAGANAAYRNQIIMEEMQKRMNEIAAKGV